MEDEDLIYIGYVCISKAMSHPPFTAYREWRYYDSDGELQIHCSGDREVRICEKAGSD
jgi:hypothetical protein